MNVDMYFGALIVLWSPANLSPILGPQRYLVRGVHRSLTNTVHAKYPAPNEQIRPDGSAGRPICDGGKGPAVVVGGYMRIGSTLPPTQSRRQRCAHGSSRHAPVPDRADHRAKEQDQLIAGATGYCGGPIGCKLSRACEAMVNLQGARVSRETNRGRDGAALSDSA